MGVNGIKYISLFSGIEAASVAWQPLGWEPICFSEIDPFPSAVLAARYPDVPNVGDITQVDWREVVERYGRPDVVVGGSPCTSFSIAGGRESLDGESRLMYEYIRACDEIRSPWILWENVPGIFSVRDGAFEQLVTMLQDIGYVSIAWRVLDAQFYSLAQRRRRVFLVAHLGTGGGASAVLFESESVRGNNQTCQEKRQALAADAARCTDNTDEVTSFKWFQGSAARSIAAYDDGTVCTLTNSDSHQPAVAFAQNQREEVRLINGDGQLACALSAQQFCTHKNETIICEPVKDEDTYVIASDHAGAEIIRGGGCHNSPSTLLQGRTDSGQAGWQLTSNGRDVFPSLCATDGDKQFIDNQSVDGGRLIIERREGLLKQLPDPMGRSEQEGVHP